jgi:hypothetical protein
MAITVTGLAAPIAIPAGSASAAVSPPEGWLTMYPVAGAQSSWSSVAGPDGNMWFVEPNANSIASVTNDGTVTHLQRYQ